VLHEEYLPKSAPSIPPVQGGAGYPSILLAPAPVSPVSNHRRAWRTSRKMPGFSRRTALFAGRL
jgi:hypothetical protein